MKLEKVASGSQKIIMSKSEWLLIGKQAGWSKEAQGAGPIGTKIHYEIRIGDGLIRRFADFAEANLEYEKMLEDNWKEDGENWDLVEITYKILRSEPARGK